jgi:hypothetical protein
MVIILLPTPKVSARRNKPFDYASIKTTNI